MSGLKVCSRHFTLTASLAMYSLLTILLVHPPTHSAAAQAGGDLLPCIQSLAFALPSASVLSDDVLSVCSEPGMGDVSGCSDCTSAANCPDPLSECMLFYAGSAIRCVLQRAGT